MKRILALVLSVVLMLGIFSGCQAAPAGGETTVATPHRALKNRKF